MPKLPVPEEIDMAADDETGCFNCGWFRYAEELSGEDDAVGHCWAMPVKPPVKAEWDACHFWKRCKEDLH